MLVPAIYFPDKGYAIGIVLMEYTTSHDDKNYGIDKVKSDVMQIGVFFHNILLSYFQSLIIKGSANKKCLWFRYLFQSTEYIEPHNQKDIINE